MRTRVTAAALSGLLVLALAGCTTPGPAEPTPTSGFSSEEEAFTAAEETYRAYVDALNQVDLSDPETFEAVYGWTTGEANANERKSLSQLHADGWVVAGDTTVTGFHPGAVTGGIVDAVVCSDVSDVQVTDATGQSVVPDNRPSQYALQVTFVESSTPTGLSVRTSDAVEDPRCNS
ncbi:hypothetical protein ACFC1I_01460 [Microbacterium sp. NPDC056044]|uniref:hypothetical protein n=1 Tax=Microbacterium sp. NPDC056044 TaxID=3345690 RepID=UPI0035DAEDF2